MKRLFSAFIFLFFTHAIYCQKDVGIRGGLNLSNNMDYGEGYCLGWHLAGYANLETYKTLSYRAELKIQQIGCSIRNMFL